MRNPTGIYVIRGIIAALVGTLGVAQLVTGHLVIGALLVALAVMQVVLLLTMHRRRAQLLERFPRLAEGRAYAGRGRGGQTHPSA